MPRADRAPGAAGALAWGPGDRRLRGDGIRHRHSGRRIGGLLAALGLLLVACGQGAVPPQDSFYRLDVGDPGRRCAVPLLDGVVEVTWPRAAGLVSLRAILHRGDGARLRPYRRHAWTDVPSRLVQDAIVETLRAANAATRVVTPRAGLRPDWRVRGALKALHHHSQETRPAAAVALALTVVDARQGAVLLRAAYRVRRVVEGPTVPAAVAAMRRALRSILRGFLDDLARAARGGDCAGASPGRGGRGAEHAWASAVRHQSRAAQVTAGTAGARRPCAECSKGAYGVRTGWCISGSWP